MNVKHLEQALAIEGTTYLRSSDASHPTTEKRPTRLGLDFSLSFAGVGACFGDGWLHPYGQVCGLLCGPSRLHDQPLIILQSAEPSLNVRCRVVEDRRLDPGVPAEERGPHRVTLPGVVLETYGAHVPPGSSNGWKKVETLEGIYSALARHSDAPRILCGDFNTPQSELADGSCVTWAQKVRPDGTVRTKRRIRHGDGQRWDAAERNVLRGLEPHGFSDVFRELHGHQPGYSFVLSRKSHVAQRRFDHLLLSGPVSASACRYIHAWRDDGLSDHSAIEAELVLDAPA